MKKSNLISVGLITAISSLVVNLPYSASASEDSQAPLTVHEAMEKAFFNHAGDVYEASTIGGFLNDVLGWKGFIEGSYPENQIRRDARLVDTIHQELWKQQTQSDETIRTQDLPNPYCSSLMTSINNTCY